MFIELAEALDCPDCREGFGLVAFVREMDGRRVVEGHLGCPQCEAEVAIRGGGVDFRLRPDPVEGGGGDPRRARRAGAEADEEVPGAPARPREPGPGRERAGEEAETAVRVAALLGLHERPSGVHLLGPGLASHAEGVAGLAERIEVLAVLPPGRPLPGGAPRDRVTPLAGVGARWPVRARHLRGVALLGGSVDAVGEAEHALAPEGRLVVFRPAEGVAGAVEGGAFEVLAAEAAAIVASKR